MMAGAWWPSAAGFSGLALAFFLVAVPSHLSPQEGSVLTLEGALERAAEHNPSYRQALNNLGLNPLDRRSALSAFLPTLTFQANTNVSVTRQRVGTDDFGYPVENPVAEWRTSSGSNQRVGLNIPLYSWGVRFQDWKIQGAQARMREADVAAQLRTLHAGVVRAYRNAQFQRALVNAEEALLARRELDLETTRRRFQLAGMSRVDVLQAELAVRQQEVRIEEARASLQKALLALRTLIGDPELVEFEVPEVLPEPFDPEALDPVALVSAAVESDPGLIRQENTLAIRQAQVKAAEGRRWNPLSLNLGFNQSDTDLDGTGSFFDPFPDRYRGGQGYFSVGVDLQVFPFRPNFTDPVQRAEIEKDNTEVALRAERLRLEEQVHSRLIDLQVAHSGYLIALQARDIAQESLELAQERFRLGSRTFTELQINIAAAADAERAVISRLFSFLQAQTNLEETVGMQLAVAEAGGGGAPSGAIRIPGIGPGKRSDRPDREG
jgi:outer membrane protein TolC